MARAFLLAAGALWLVVGVATALLALLGREWLISRLPPLAIDADALGGALTAAAVAVAVLAVAHFVVAGGVAARRRWAMSGGTLLAAGLAVALFALASAATASAVRESSYAGLLLVGAGAAALAAIGYALVGRSFLRELASGSTA